MSKSADMPEGLEKSYAQEATGAMRASIGTKIDVTLVPFELKCAAAMGLLHGEKKYAARNFEKGLSYKSLCLSIDRHNKAILDGEDIDEDSGLPHYALLASSVAMLCHNIMQGVIIDNRPVRKVGKSVSEIAALAQATYLGSLK